MLVPHHLKTPPPPPLGKRYTVEPRYNEVLGTMKITLLYQVSHYIRVKKQRNIKSWDQQNYLVIRGFCYIRPLYNEVPLYSLSRILATISNDKKRLISRASLEIFPRLCPKIPFPRKWEYACGPLMHSGGGG